MLKKYVKKVTVLAEQFDGSKEMAKQYGLKKFGYEDWIRVPNYRDNFEIGAPMMISEGDWLLVKENGRYDVLSDEEFRRTYERCD